jgi:beta-lactamase regulating signal transducer with metallopeptidase domain
MLSIMLYLMLIAGLLGTAGLAIEKILTGARRARRGVWLATLVASIVLPAYWLAAGVEVSARGVSADTRTMSAAVQPEREAATLGAAPSAGPFTLPDWRRWPLFNRGYLAWLLESNALDKPLTVFWIASSLGFTLVYGLAWLALRRRARRWQTTRVDGGEVLISNRIGPAMFGLLRPRIVIPRWLHEASGDLQAMVLCHEREHIAARDHVLLAAGLAVIALSPWNIALWWQLRRLRLAIETDCDARVVHRGVDVGAYANGLLAVRLRRVAAPFAAVALMEPVSQLERRIRLVLQAPRRLRRSVAAGAVLVAAGLVATACAVNPPALKTTIPEGGAHLAGARQPLTGMRVAGDRVVILVDVSATMLDWTRSGGERRRDLSPGQQRASGKWRQLTETVHDLTAQIDPNAQFQVIAFDGAARSLVPGSDGEWLMAAERANSAIRTLGSETSPSGPRNLAAAFAAAAALQPPPDTIYVVTDGLPTVGPSGREAEGEEARMRLFEDAITRAPKGAAVNVILLPLDDDVLAAPAYWTLALRTGGSLLAPAEGATDGEIPGVALDTEYLIFVIDTSGSMHQLAWENVRAQVVSTLAAYPALKGLQFLNDEGEHLLDAFQRDWIPNTAERRTEILDALTNWRPFSKSTPGKGILAAIDSAAPDQKVAIYIYGDDFADGTVSEVLASINDHNRDSFGNRKTRINSVAFPVIYDATGSLLTSASYASLMRDLAQRNGGSFIGLPAKE